MDNLNSILLFSSGVVLATIIFVIYTRYKNKIRRETGDPVPQHKHALKPPTRRFQKFNPSECPHHNGIYRKVLENNQERSIFVCADCVSIVQLDELELRDKFKGQTDGRLLHSSKHN